MARRPWTFKPKQGVMYRLVYKSQSGSYQWYEYESIAKYIGTGRTEDELLFSYRPHAGTTEFARDQILEAYEMPRTTEPRLPRRRGKHQPVRS